MPTATSHTSTLPKGCWDSWLIAPVLVVLPSRSPKASCSASQAISRLTTP